MAIKESELYTSLWKYRDRLRIIAGPVIEAWETKLGVSARQWGIKRMKTKWGSCNPDARRIWLNLTLITESAASLEYVIVHELLHLVVRRHDDRFISLMHRHLPPWPQRRADLNASRLASESWAC